MHISWSLQLTWNLFCLANFYWYYICDRVVKPVCSGAVLVAHLDLSCRVYSIAEPAEVGIGIDCRFNFLLFILILSNSHRKYWICISSFLIQLCFGRMNNKQLAITDWLHRYQTVMLDCMVYSMWRHLNLLAGSATKTKKQKTKAPIWRP